MDRMSFIEAAAGAGGWEIGREHPVSEDGKTLPANAHAYPVCHREEHSDVAISLLQETAAATTRLPRFARNDSSTETGYASAANGVAMLRLR